jgi:hypothetical protein
MLGITWNWSFCFCELNYTPEKEDGSIDPKKQLLQNHLKCQDNFGLTLFKKIKLLHPENL